MISSTNTTLVQHPPHSNYEKTTFSAEESAFLMDALRVKHCFNCNATSTSQWRKNPLNKSQDECQKCYTAARSALAKSGNSRKTCFNCNGTSTHMWYKNPLDKTQDECSKCYQRAKKAIQQTSTTTSSTESPAAGNKRKRGDDP